MNSEMTFSNFSLSEGVKKSFKNKIETLLDVSPSDSGVSSNITKTLTGYLGKLQIVSSQGRFAVTTAGQDLEDMIKSLFNLMHREIINWRNTRLF